MKTVKIFSMLAVLLMGTVSCMAKEIKTVVFKDQSRDALCKLRGKN